MSFWTNALDFLKLRNQLLVSIYPRNLFYLNHRIIYHDMRRRLFMLLRVHFQHLHFLTVTRYEGVAGVNTQLSFDLWVGITDIIDIRIKWLLELLELLTNILTILDRLLHIKRL